MASSKSEQLFGRARKVIPGGVNSPVRFYEPYPFFAVSAKGSKITTADHKTLLDYCMGYGAVLLGHAYPSVAEAVKNQIENGNLFCVPTEKEVRLAEMISKVVPCAEMVRITNTGAEATMHSIRLARAFTRKKKVVKFDGCYHGAYDYVLVKAGSAAAGLSSSEGVLDEASSQTVVLPYNDNAALERFLEKDHEVACIIVEPVLANMGLVLPDRQYLVDLRKITQQKDIVLIFDEVVTGFRIALGGAGEFFGVRPDLVAFAKALGNGFPIAAIGGKKEIMQQFAPQGDVFQASTYAGNPISVTAAIASLEALNEMKNVVYPQISRACDNIVDGIKDEIEDSRLDGHCVINSIRSMYQLFFTGQSKIRDANTARTSRPGTYRRLFDELLRKEIFIPPSQFETCFLSYAHSEDDADKTVEAYGSALRKIKNDGGK